MKVALCHEGFAAGDAIGCDIAGMYRLLELLGIQPTVICGWHSHDGGFRILRPPEVQPDSFELIIYHHSQYWEEGARIIQQARCPLIFRYHNITPPAFFCGYAPRYEELCRRGLEQTQTFLELQSSTWMCNSEFTRHELLRLGARPEEVCVVSPFNRAEQLLVLPSSASYASETVELLFVGRFVPHKGHAHLLRVASLLMDEFCTPMRLHIVGSFAPAPESYRREIDEQIRNLGLQNYVETHGGCDDAHLVDLYRRCHVYLCLSEHEGFNVPVIEAQAVGLPLVAAAAAATEETAGAGQLLAPLPQSLADDRLYAALIEEICTNEDLRRQLILDGERNVRNRFAAEIIENAFVQAIHRVIARS